MQWCICPVPLAATEIRVVPGESELIVHFDVRLAFHVKFSLDAQKYTLPTARVVFPLREGIEEGERVYTLVACIYQRMILIIVRPRHYLAASARCVSPPSSILSASF